MRSHESKEYAIYLDHAGNVARHGFAECIVPDVLDKKEQGFDERQQTKKKEKAEASVKDCPQCSRQMMGLRCQCGYEITITEALRSTNELLVRITADSKEAKPQHTTKYKSHWYSNLLNHAREKGYKDGWAAHQYRKKFGVWPRQLKIDVRQEQLPEVHNWLKSRQIAYSKSKWHA